MIGPPRHGHRAHRTGGVACGDVYRFLLSPRWLGLGLLMVMAAATWWGSGLWQLDRLPPAQRDQRPHRRRDGGRAPPWPCPGGAGAGAAGVIGARPARRRPGPGYGHRPLRPAHEILARARTVDGRVGFEIITPLVLADGTAVLVDRGWVPPPAARRPPPRRSRRPRPVR